MNASEGVDLFTGYLSDKASFVLWKHSLTKGRKSLQMGSPELQGCSVTNSILGHFAPTRTGDS